MNNNLKKLIEWFENAFEKLKISPYNSNETDLGELARKFLKFSMAEKCCLAKQELAKLDEKIASFEKEKQIAIEALEYYADRNGGPYAAGDYHTADGGERALKALEKLGVK